MGSSMKLFTVVSLLLLVSMSPDMGGPVGVDAIASCFYMDLCVKYCDLAAPGEGACCPGPLGPCRCTRLCPLLGSVEITEKMMVDAQAKKYFTREELQIA